MSVAFRYSSACFSVQHSRNELSGYMGLTGRGLGLWLIAALPSRSPARFLACQWTSKPGIDRYKTWPVFRGRMDSLHHRRIVCSEIFRGLWCSSLPFSCAVMGHRLNDNVEFGEFFASQIVAVRAIGSVG